MGRKARRVLRAPRRRRRVPFAKSVAGIVVAVVLAVILSPHPPASSGAFLDQVPVELGSGNVTAKPGAPHSVVIGCATGTPTDQFRDVRYVLAGRYADLHATVLSESLVELRLYRDNRAPVAAGRSADLDLDLTGVDRLLIRVTCQSPGGSVILADARLRPA